MPTISKFYGIIIRMYFQQSEHNPPHLHAIYNDHVAVFNIDTGEIIEGFLPAKASKMVKNWCYIHKDELLEIWNSQQYDEIKPLETFYKVILKMRDNINRKD